MKRILIAEDEAAYSNALTFRLKKEGFEVSIARDGAIALDLMRNREYDLLILDLIMPKMNGFEVLEELRKSGTNVPVMILSNLSQAADIERAKALGVVEFIVKSDISLVALMKRIKQRLGEVAS
jgi:DNA-binding response OmpR family regulator